MSWRVVVISSRARLETKLGYLVVRGTETKRILLDEISVLLIENTGCVLSLSLLDALMERKIAVIVCDSKHNPGAQVLPFYGSYNNSGRIYSQLQWKQEAKDRVWAAIVKDKIYKQSLVLKKYIRGPDWERVFSYMDDIQPGDSTNREAHAAKVYFNALLGHEFSRKESSAINAALDYGYTIILSSVSRCIVANGFMTQLGIFHHNIFNQFNLSSDIMEPFRPLVDEKVLSLPMEETLTTENKLAIVNMLNDIVSIRGRQTIVLLAIDVYVKSVLDALETGNPELIAFYET